MKHWKPTISDEEISAEFPYILIAYREEAKRIKKIIKGTLENNKKLIDEFIVKLTKNVPEEKFLLTVLFVKSEKDWDKIIQRGRLKKKRKAQISFTY